MNLARLGLVDHRSPARHSLPPLRGRRDRPRDPRHDRPPDQPKPAPDRGRPDPVRPVGARPSRRPGRLAVRAGRAELRSVHQLRDSLAEAEDREIMSLIVGLGSPHGDDQLGWVAIDRLRPRLPASIFTQKVRGGLELTRVSRRARRGSRHRRGRAGRPAWPDPIVRLALP